MCSNMPTIIHSKTCLLEVPMCMRFGGAITNPTPPSFAQHESASIDCLPADLSKLQPASAADVSLWGNLHSYRPQSDSTDLQLNASQLFEDLPSNYVPPHQP